MERKSASLFVFGMVILGGCVSAPEPKPTSFTASSNVTMGQIYADIDRAIRLGKGEYCSLFPDAGPAVKCWYVLSGGESVWLPPDTRPFAVSSTETQFYFRRGAVLVGVQVDCWGQRKFDPGTKEVHCGLPPLPVGRTYY